MNMQAAGFLIVLAAVNVAGLAGPTNMSAAERQTLPGHTVAAIRKLGLQPIGRLAATNQLNLAIGLPLRNADELTLFLHELYDPASPRFHHYLTTEEFTARFGPTRDQYEVVRRFALKHGLRITVSYPNRLVLDVAGTASAIEQAFAITLHTYQHPLEKRQFYAPDAEPSVDAGLAILAINGLDDFVLPHPMNVRRTPAPVPRAQGVLTGSGTNGAYLAADLRAAYVPGVTLTGAGQIVGLLEFDGYNTGDITAYEALAGLPNVPLYNVLLDGFNGVAGYGNSEVALDIEMAISMAPGLAGVIVYEGGLAQDMLNHMASDNQAKQLSSSWGWQPYDSNSDQIFMEFAAQGQTYFNASGDSDAYVNGVYLAPEDDPYITLVGGTTLTTTGPGGAWLAEKVWNLGNGEGSAGGISVNYAIPAYQQGIDMSANHGSTTNRNMPDVAMVADNILVVADGGQQEIMWGTSCAAPLWAGFTALVNEQSIKASSNTVGVLNPALYALGKGVDYAYTFHDIVAGNNEWSDSPSNFIAVPGYDLCTGWGTPKGAALIDALAPPDVLVVFPSAGFDFMGYAGVPFPAAQLAMSLSNSSAASLTWAAGSSSTWLSISPTTGTVSPEGPAVTMTVSANDAATNLSPGTYTNLVWITNLSDGVVQSPQFTLQVLDDLQVLPTNGLLFSRTETTTFPVTSQNITITNAGPGILNWVAASPSDWLNVQPSSGILAGASSASVSVSLTPAGLGLGVGTFSNSIWFINLNDLTVQATTITISVASLLVNGGFETGDFTGWTLSGDTNGLFVMPATMYGTTYDYVHAGMYSAALGSYGELGFLSQTVPTTPGAHYSVSLWYFKPDGETPNQFEVVWDGRLLFSAVNMPKRHWTQLRFPVTATSTNATLQIGGQDEQSLIALDDVSVTLEPLLITPGAGFSSTGFVGGPFSVTNQSLVLTNVGGGLVSWGLASTPAWLSVSSSGGVLAPGESATVSVSLSAAAAELPMGQYASALYITNLSDGTVQSNDYSLQVQSGPDPLQILPASLVFSRAAEGAFSPASLNLELTNGGAAPLNWSLTNTSTWFSALPGNGALSPGGPAAQVTLALQGSVASLPAGNYTNTIWFTNLSDSTVQSVKVLLLTLPLVQNGGFETGDFTSWTQIGDFSYCAVGTSPLYAHSGTNGASMGPQGTLSYLAQTLPTTAGQLYLLSFWLDSPDGLTPNEFSASWNGITLLDRTNLGSIGWTNLQYFVTATDPSTVIQFGFRNDQSYFGFDDVSVVPVAMPAFQGAAASNNAFTLSWTAQPGFAYQVQYATQLSPANWTNLGSTFIATNASTTFSDPMSPGGDTMRFYRVLLMP